MNLPNVLEKIKAELAAFMKYSPYAIPAITEVESVIGTGNGATKKQMVVGAILALAHAGETVPAPQVQAISGIVDMLVSTMNGMGVFGKTAPVAVPTAVPAA